MGWIVLLLVIVAVLLGARLPVCICNKPDCGGGCMEG